LRRQDHGRVIGFDKISLLFNTLDTLKFLIATKLTSTINEDIVLCLEGKDCYIHIQELDNQHFPAFETIEYSMQTFSPHMEDEEETDSESNPDSHAKVAQVVNKPEFKVDGDTWDVSLYHCRDSYANFAALPKETLFPGILEVHSSNWLLNRNMRSQFSSDTISMGDEDSSA
jgi:hypothetical protein